MNILMYKSLFKSNLYKNDVIQFLNYIWGYAIVVFLGYWLNYLLNTNLEKSQLGLFSYIQSIISILSPLLCIGFYHSYLRFHHNHAISSSLLKMARPFYFLSFIICSIVIISITKEWFAALYATTVFFVEKQYFLRTRMQILKLNILKCCELLIPISLIYILTYFNFSLNSSIICILYGVGFCMFFLFPSETKFAEKNFDNKDIYKYLVPVVITTLLTYLLLNMGIIIAKQIYGLNVAAELSVALRALLILKNITAIFLMFFPMVYFREAQNKKYNVINFYRTIIIVVAISTAIPLMIFPHFIYTLLGAGKYHSTANILSLLTIGELLSFISSLYALFFNFEIKTWKNLIFKTLSVIIFIIAVFILKKHGITGMAWAYLGAGVFNFVIILPIALYKEITYFYTSRGTL